MTFPERFSDLPEYAFPRLRALLDGHAPGGPVVSMSIGEPKHAFPEWVPQIIAENASEFGKYPPNEGSPELLNAIAGWISRRYGVDLALDQQVMALNGTREGLFNACLALCPEKTAAGQRPAILIPNPFYQVYAVAALAVGAEPVYLPALAETGFLPDFASLDPALLDRTEIAYICTPSNPQGAVASRDYLAQLFALAERHDFKVFADECYSELYAGNTAPVGALQVAKDMGISPERVLLFNSLSKRSSLAGLRSGFVAGGPDCIARIKQLRTYAGAPLPLPLQRVAQQVWGDEAHVAHNRALYQDKYQLADEIFAGVPGFQPVRAGFFLWLPVEDAEAATLKIWRETGVRVLPGPYLGREVDGRNPGDGYIRAALVAPRDELAGGLKALRACIYG
ncbi:N-succinyl-L,L-diaminopimelate aminotransferase alternative [Candidatus Rhodobacter oscarellae]|uniref:N-succinyl-L,L-diaminopimelate aminotransferase alternative n=1 Tax=Candidatus Rhodobacter oscarellae TaxID=1675527 RepID=A0A0J9E7B7_9RHOB|nr:aminotransferase class I/II-fold pyridoxal phosphate-dependent enzyme [Candidatus Rhodobacter lobularis]KMW58601.1 N-succinyl-L,L-diaminopimelate aminotransferase alternative [Candidatus Rhodobacter lobularis]